MSDKLFKDLIDPLRGDGPQVVLTEFQILTNADLSFDYSIQKNGNCLTESDNFGVHAAEQYGYIKIINENIDGNLNRFNGGAEPVLNGTLKFVQPCTGSRDLVGEDLEIQEFGNWKCTRCTYISYIPITKGKVASPFICFNDDCGRKGAFVPQFPLDLTKPIWKIPLSPIETTSIEIYTEIYNFIKLYLVLKEEEYHIMTLWIMASWLVDDFQTCPYLCLIAPKSSGKSQALGVLSELSYRAVAAISVTAAALFRAIELWHVTLLIDEAEYQVKQDTEAGQALYGCLNGGYKRGSFALRIEGDASARVPTAYDVFGFKAIASTKLFHPTLESRSIVFNMSQGMPQKILIDSQSAAVLRSKLLFWRFETLGKLPIVMPSAKIGRLIEMFIPLFTVAQTLNKSKGIKKPISYKDLLTLLNDKITEMESNRKDEEHESTEAQILQAIFYLIDHPGEGAFGDRDTIALKDVAFHLKTEKEWDEIPGKEKIATTIGRRLKVMGVPTKHTNHGKTIEYMKDDVDLKLNELKKRYIIVTDSDGK